MIGIRSGSRSVDLYTFVVCIKANHLSERRGFYVRDIKDDGHNGRGEKLRY